MTINNPWADGPRGRTKLIVKMWLGALALFFGASVSAIGFFSSGDVRIWVVVVALCGLYVVVTGMVKLWTDYR